jgi:hypothetical protein
VIAEEEVEEVVIVEDEVHPEVEEVAAEDSEVETKFSFNPTDCQEYMSPEDPKTHLSQKIWFQEKVFITKKELAYRLMDKKYNIVSGIHIDRRSQHRSSEVSTRLELFPEPRFYT